MSDDNQEMRLVFLGEMGELVQDIEEDLLQLEDAPSSRGLVDRLFRSLHTIKGGAGMTGMELLSHYTRADDPAARPITSECSVKCRREQSCAFRLRPNWRARLPFPLY